MAVRDTLNRVENLVASAWHLPLTGKAVIDEEELVHLIEDLRRDLPQELEQAEKVIQERENIFNAARQEADDIVKQAKAQAEKLVDENDIVAKARQTAQMIVSEAQRQGDAYVEQATQHATQLRESADNYTNQVLTQLQEHIVNIHRNVQEAGTKLEQSWQLLNQAKVPVNRQPEQNPNYQQPVPAQDYQQNQYQQQGYQQNQYQQQDYQPNQYQQLPDYQQNPPPQQN